MRHKILAFLEDDCWPHIGDVIGAFPKGQTFNLSIINT